MQDSMNNSGPLARVLMRKSESFTWTSGTQRLGHPLYWYSRQGRELWFVNSTQDVLPKLVSTGAGSATIDDDEVVTTSPTPERAYADIQPGEGVLVDVFDDLDLDFLVQTSVQITEINGRERWLSSCGKGGSGTRRLLSPGDLVEEDSHGKG